MPAPACSLFCFFDLSGIVWPLKSQTRSYLFNMNIVIWSILWPMRRTILLIWGRTFQWMLKLCGRQSSRLLWLLEYWWVLLDLAANLVILNRVFESHRCSLKGPALLHNLSHALCSFQWLQDLPVYLGLIFFCQPQESSIWLHWKYHSALVQCLYQHSSTKGRWGCENA